MGGLSDVDAELFRKLSEFATVANRGDVSKALDAANLVFAHGMFKCGLQRTTDERRAHMLRTCAERFLGALCCVATNLSKLFRNILQAG